MNPHFFTAPFYFAFIWFRVQGSGLSWRLRRDPSTQVAAVLDDETGRCPKVCDGGFPSYLI